jgi:hypothetical protein
MADSAPKQIIAAFVARAAQVDGVAVAYDKEARDIPGEVREGACVVALWRGCPQVVKETGDGSDVTWEWSIRIYVGLPDFETAQDDFYAVVPAVLALGRSQGFNGDLDALDGVYTGSLSLTDAGAEPHFDADAGWAMKELRLRVESYAAGVA